LTNTGNGDVSTKVKTVNVVDGSIQLEFTISDITPDIGQTVFFDIEGVPGDIDSATWNFGGTGCSPYTQLHLRSHPTIRLHVRLLPVLDLRDQDGAGHGGVRASRCRGDAPPHRVLVRRLWWWRWWRRWRRQWRRQLHAYTLNPTSAHVEAGAVRGSSACWPGRMPVDRPIARGLDHHHPGTSGSGPGTVRYACANSNPAPRVGEIAASHTFTLTQLAMVPTDFNVSVTDPEIGEEVVFTVHETLEPVSWDFGSPDCGWNGPAISCTANPAACRDISWYFRQAGLFDVTLTTTTGTRTRTVWVRNVGECADICYATGAPDPAFTLTPNPVQAGTEVVFFHSEEPVVEVCEFVLDPEAASYPAAGGAGTVLVTTADTASG
jgi:hypothetical protein